MSSDLLKIQHVMSQKRSKVLAPLRAVVSVLSGNIDIKMISSAKSKSRSREYALAVSAVALLSACAGSQGTRYGVVSPPSSETPPLEAYRLSASSYGSETTMADKYRGAIANINAEGLDASLKPIHLTFPSYPDDAQKQGIEGVVEVLATIDEKGEIESAVIFRSVHPLLDQAALDAIKTWRFAPASFQGKPAKFPFRQRFPFVLTRAPKR